MQSSALRSAANDQSAFPADYSYEKWLDDLRGLVWDAFTKGKMSLEDIAVMANLHYTTVERFAWSETKNPALRTVFRLSEAIGFRMPPLTSNPPPAPTAEEMQNFRSTFGR